jgi:hypothetical protein
LENHFRFSFLQVENRPDLAKRVKKHLPAPAQWRWKINVAVTRTDGNGNFEPH